MSAIATHENPAWRGQADFVIHASLARFGMPGRWEQLWAKRDGQDTFEICCIPFFTYGIALGDVVRAEVGRQFEYEVSDGVDRRGHKVARVAVIDRQRAPKIHDGLHEALSRSFPHEWYAVGYVAIDVTEAVQEAELRALLQPYAERGDVSYEIE